MGETHGCESWAEWQARVAIDIQDLEKTSEIYALHRQARGEGVPRSWKRKSGILAAILGSPLTKDGKKSWVKRYRSRLMPLWIK